MGKERQGNSASFVFFFSFPDFFGGLLEERFCEFTSFCELPLSNFIKKPGLLGYFPKLNWWKNYSTFLESEIQLLSFQDYYIG